MTDTLEVTIGWTRSDMANGYSSFDGYRPGASQHTETITLDVPEAGATPSLSLVERIADAVFDATNAPRTGHTDGLVGQVCRKIDALDFDGRQSGHYSLSVGDTVTVAEVMLACAPTGWERVTIAPEVAS